MNRSRRPCRPSRVTRRPAPGTSLLVACASLFAGSLLAGPGTARAQQPADVPPAADAAAEAPQEAGQALRVFIDCATRFCDLDFLRREIPFINYVRDRRDAQVHLLVTSERTGAGGTSFTLDFIGREEFEGVDDRLQMTARLNLAEEEVLERLSRTIKLGLMRYMARTPAAERLEIVFEAGEEETVARPEDDPWNFWVFRASMRGSFNGEDRRDFLSAFGSFSADRITEALKVELSVDARYFESNFEVSDTVTVTSITRNYELETLVVWSLGDHWSAGAETSAEHSTFRNREVALRLAPALEYNLFRYEESERKQLTFLYSVGFNNFDWRERTIFGKTSETRLDQALEVGLRVKQPWGEAGGSLELSHFLDEPGQNRIEGGVGVRFRLLRGLSLDVSGNASRVRDQINLPAGDATQEEVLLRIRELQTGLEYGLSFGFSYTFGSIFSNVVNPRF